MPPYVMISRLVQQALLKGQNYPCMPISEIQLTLPYVLNVESAVSLKWSVGFENDMKITPIFYITFSSKMLIRQCFTSLEHTFLDDGLNSL